jgi:hypothetical protein
MCYRAEGQDRTKPGHSADLGDQKLTAVRDLARFRLVLRRDAANCIGDAHAPELETVIRTGVIIALGEPVFPQCRIQQSTRVIAGKWAPRPVRTAQARREAYNQQFGSGIAEGRNRAIEPFRVGPPLSLPESSKARAEGTVPWRLNLRRRSGQASSTGSVRVRLTSSRI